MLPGEPIGRRSATRGLRVQGLDQGNIWYNATVKQVHPDNSKVLLAFTGFGAAHNRWHILKDKTVRARLPADKLKKETELRVWGKVVGRQADGTWQVSSIIGKRRTSKKWEYQVEWVGEWANTWEPASNLPTELTTAFEDNERARRGEDELPAAKPPSAPYSVEVAKGDQASETQRLLDAEEWASDVALEAATVTRRQIRPRADMLLHSARPCPAWAFVGLARLLSAWARELRPEGPPALPRLPRPASVLTVPPCAVADDVSNLVSAISAHRSAVTPDGRHVCTDVFTVYSDDVVDRLLGQGVLVVQHAKNRAAVKLVAPLSFFWRAERGLTGPEGVKKLTVKGHYVTLVADQANAGEVTFCTDHERYEYEPTAIHAYKQGMAAALLRSDDTGIPPLYITFANSGLLA